MANEHQGLQAADFPEEWQPVEDPTFEINVNIHIACCEPDEVSQHLIEILNQYRKEMRRRKSVGEKGTEEPMKLLDNNCYGTHAVDINFNTQPSKTSG